MRSRKRAFIFPDLEIAENEEINLFSPKELDRAASVIVEPFNVFGSMARLYVERHNREELAKQIRAKKETLDEQILQAAEQEKIRFSEELQRMDEQLKTEKKRFLSEFHQMYEKDLQKSKNFSRQFEEHLRIDQNLLELLQRERVIMEQLEEFIDRLSDDFTRMAEYIRFCDSHRRAMEILNRSIQQMI